MYECENCGCKFILNKDKLIIITNCFKNISFNYCPHCKSWKIHECIQKKKIKLKFINYFETF